MNKGKICSRCSFYLLAFCNKIVHESSFSLKNTRLVYFLNVFVMTPILLLLMKRLHYKTFRDARKTREKECYTLLPSWSRIRSSYMKRTTAFQTDINNNEDIIEKYDQHLSCKLQKWLRMHEYVSYLLPKCFAESMAFCVTASSPSVTWPSSLPVKIDKDWKENKVQNELAGSK